MIALPKQCVIKNGETRIEKFLMPWDAILGKVLEIDKEKWEVVHVPDKPRESLLNLVATLETHNLTKTLN